MSVFIGNNCKIDPTATIGKSCCIGDNTIIRKNVIIGNNVTICENCILGETPTVWDAECSNKGFEGKLIIGNNCCIKPYVVIERGFCGHTSIGDNCFISSGCGIGHDVHIGNDCIFFPFVCVLGNATIGNNTKALAYSLIGNGSVVGEDSIIYFKAFAKNSIEPKSFIVGQDGATLKEHCKKRKLLKRIDKLSQRIKILEDAIDGRNNKKRKR